MYKIIYDRRLIRVTNEEFILLMNTGLDNDYVSYKKPAKKWELIKNGDKKLLTINDVKEIADLYNSRRLAKARKNFFKEGELKNYILSSLSNPITLEEAISWDESNNSLILTVNGQKLLIKSTKSLLNCISNATSVEFSGRDFTPKKREFKKDFIENKKTFFALCNPEGRKYLSGVSLNGYKFQKDPTDKVIKFDSPEMALKFIEKFPILKDFKVRQMRTYDYCYVLRTDNGQYYKSKRKYSCLYVPYINSAKLFKSENLASRYLNDYDLIGLKVEKVFKTMYLPA